MSSQDVQEHLEFLKSQFSAQFDKLLVASICVAVMFWITHLLHHAMDATAVDKAWQVLFTLLGVLTTLITGARLTQRKPDNSNGAAAAPPVNQPQNGKP